MTVSSLPTTQLDSSTLSSALADHPPVDKQLGRLIVFTGPSGVGKGTLLKALRKRHPELKLSISATTRDPRPGEVNGQDYYFVSREEFNQMEARGDLLESAEFAGNYYGTPKVALLDQMAAGEWVILEIEVAGARQVRQSFPQALQLFVLPPSLTELEDRIRQRGKDNEASIEKRLTRARDEIAAAPEFDIQIVNDDLEMALHQLEAAIFER